MDSDNLKTLCLLIWTNLLWSCPVWVQTKCFTMTSNICQVTKQELSNPNITLTSNAMCAWSTSRISATWSDTLATGMAFFVGRQTNRRSIFFTWAKKTATYIRNIHCGAMKLPKNLEYLASKTHLWLKEMTTWLNLMKMLLSIRFAPCSELISKKNIEY